MSSQFIHQTGQPYTAVARGGRWSWRAVDIVTLAVLGCAFGVAFWGFDSLLYPGLTAVMTGFPPAQEILLGVWLLPCVVGMLLVRRPGAALLVELVAANLEMLLGNRWGSLVLISAVLQALGVEIVAALFRWRSFSLRMAMAAGAMAALLEIVIFEWWSYVGEYALDWKLVYLAAGLISGVLVAGIGGFALVKALAATGSVNAFPPGEEHLVAADPVHGAFPAAR
jgi:energy-coupling factor transport system permease protein